MWWSLLGRPTFTLWMTTTLLAMEPSRPGTIRGCAQMHAWLNDGCRMDRWLAGWTAGRVERQRVRRVSAPSLSRSILGTRRGLNKYYWTNEQRDEEGCVLAFLSCGSRIVTWGASGSGIRRPVFKSWICHDLPCDLNRLGWLDFSVPRSSHLCDGECVVITIIIMIIKMWEGLW